MNQHQPEPCLFCYAGDVDLYIGRELADTIRCPECHGAGTVNHAQAVQQADSLQDFNRALAGEQL